MKIWLLAAAASLLLLGANGGGCGADPGHIGVQDYGSVTGRVIDAKTNKPVTALVAIGTTVTATTDAQGAFTLDKVPAGTETITASSGGYVTASMDVKVKKDQTTQVDYIKLTPL
ncbi:MAG: carboxypeptidase-like regulatory domain-containing protein [Candidatus Eremiobacteraeota bacterium]|nr:carboxypeptidase-like regulatory domain-containing protein [Candidatus Eremiobacteraeota bacterium]